MVLGILPILLKTTLHLDSRKFQCYISKEVRFSSKPYQVRDNQPPGGTNISKAYLRARISLGNFPYIFHLLSMLWTFSGVTRKVCFNTLLSLLGHFYAFVCVSWSDRCPFVVFSFDQLSLICLFSMWSTGDNIEHWVQGWEIKRIWPRGVGISPPSRGARIRNHEESHTGKVRCGLLMYLTEVISTYKELSIMGPLRTIPLY